MSLRIRFLCCVGIAVVAVTILSGAYGAGSAVNSTRAAVVSGSFVGRLPGTKTLIAVVASDLKAGTASRAVRLYFCDGTRTFEWFAGESKGNTVSLESATHDAHVQVALTTYVASGTVTLPGIGKRRFTTVPAAGVTGLYLGHVSLSGQASGRAETGARLEGTVDSKGVTGRLIPPQGASVRFVFPGKDLKPVDFRLIVHPSGEMQGARAKRNAKHGFNLWEKTT